MTMIEKIMMRMMMMSGTCVNNDGGVGADSVGDVDDDEREVDGNR